MKEKVIQFYIEKLKQLTVEEIIEIINKTNVKDKTFVVERLFICSVLVTRKIFNRIFYRKRVDSQELLVLQSTAAVDIFLLKIKYISDEITFKTIRGLIRDTFGEYYSLSFDYIPEDEDKLEFFEYNYEDMVISEDIKRKLISITPEELKIPMFVYLQRRDTSVINFYSLQDKIIFYKILEEFDVMDKPEENRIIEYLNNLTSFSERAIFLYLLYEENPEVFFLAVSFSDFNTVYNYVRFFEDEGRLSLNDLMVSLLKVKDQVETFLVSNKRIPEDKYDFYRLIGKKINFNIYEGETGKLMNSYLSKLYDKYDAAIDSIDMNSTNRNDLVSINRMLHSEVSNHVALLEKMIELRDKS